MKNQTAIHSSQGPRERASHLIWPRCSRGVRHSNWPCRHADLLGSRFPRSLPRTHLPRCQNHRHPMFLSVLHPFSTSPPPLSQPRLNSPGTLADCSPKGLAYNPSSEALFLDSMLTARAFENTCGKRTTFPTNPLPLCLLNAPTFSHRLRQRRRPTRQGLRRRLASHDPIRRAHHAPGQLRRGHERRRPGPQRARRRRGELPGARRSGEA